MIRQNVCAVLITAHVLVICELSTLMNQLVYPSISEKLGTSLQSLCAGSLVDVTNTLVQ